MMLTKHIFDYYPIPEKKTNRGSSGHRISKGVEKSMQKFQNQLEKKWIFLWVIKKKSCGFSIVLGFFVLEFLRGGARMCGISKSESLFSKGKVKHL